MTQRNLDDSFRRFANRTAPILKELQDAFWGREAALPNLPHGLPPDSLIHGCKIFMSVFMDAMWPHAEAQNMPMKQREAAAELAGKELRSLCRDYCGIDPVEYYSRKNEES